MERFDFVCDLVDTLTDTSFGSPLFDTDDNMRLALEAFGIRFDRKVKVGTILVLDEVNAKDFIPYPYDRPHILFGVLNKIRGCGLSQQQKTLLNEK